MNAKSACNHKYIEQNLKCKTCHTERERESDTIHIAIEQVDANKMKLKHMNIFSGDLLN